MTTDTTNMGPNEASFYRHFHAEFPGASIVGKLRRLDEPVVIDGQEVTVKEYLYTIKYADGTERKGSVLWDFEWGVNMLKAARGQI